MAGQWDLCYLDGVLAEIKKWPDDVYADFLKLAKLLSEYGNEIRMPFSRPLGDGLFELRCRGRDVIGRAFYVFEMDRKIAILESPEKSRPVGL